MDAAVGGAGADRHHRPGLGGKVVDPPVHGQRLPGVRVVAERGPVTLALDDVLVGDRALDHEDERLQLAGHRRAERSEELLAAHRRGQNLVVQVDLGQPGDEPEHDVFDRRLVGRGDRDRVAVAAHALGDPQDVHLGEAGAVIRRARLLVGVRPRAGRRTRVLHVLLGPLRRRFPIVAVGFAGVEPCGSVACRRGRRRRGLLRLVEARPNSSSACPSTASRSWSIVCAPSSERRSATSRSRIAMPRRPPGALMARSPRSSSGISSSGAK